LKYSLCTISFRHQLISFEEIIHFAAECGFDGIELWGIHALNLSNDGPELLKKHLTQLKESGQTISMISDYLDISSEAQFEHTLEKCKKLIHVCQSFGSRQIRTFAGQKGSRDVGHMERKEYVRRLRILSELCKQHGIYLVLETHPSTLTDQLDSTLSLLEEINHDYVKINLDFLHVWEGGTDPLKGYQMLQPWVAHFHLKNISAPLHLPVFQPHNVYAASGSREGMVPLRDGVLDYAQILQPLQKLELHGSIEWFGPNTLQILKEEIEWLKEQRVSQLVL